jgi:hypothetical protein
MKRLEAAEKPLDEVRLGIAGDIVGTWCAVLAPGRNYHLGTLCGQRRDEQVGIVAAVGRDNCRGQVLEQRQSLRRIVALASRKLHAYQLAAGIGYHV